MRVGHTVGRENPKQRLKKARLSDIVPAEQDCEGTQFDIDVVDGSVGSNRSSVQSHLTSLPNKPRALGDSRRS